MKIMLSFKDPDWDQGSIREAVVEDLGQVIYEILSDPEYNKIVDERVDNIQEDLYSKWLEFGEYINLEYDTESKILRVLSKDEL